MSRGVLILSILLGAVPAYAYQWPAFPNQGSLEDPSPINDVIGAYRDTELSGCPAPCPHLHDGTDIGLPIGTTVYPSVSGTAVSASAQSVDVVAGNRYSYIHIVPDAVLVNEINNSPNGVAVEAGVRLLGTINSEAHLHFRERDSGNLNVLNNLRAGGLDNYIDNVSPTVSNISLLDTTNPVQPLDISKPITAKEVTIRAHAQDAQSNGSSNTGIYQIGYQVFSADGSQLLVNKFPAQTYNSFPRSFIGSPGNAYDTSVSQGFMSGVFNAFYFASNAVDPTLKPTPLDMTQFSDGQYKLCVLAKDIKGNGGDLGDNPPQGAACVNFIGNFLFLPVV